MRILVPVDGSENSMHAVEFIASRTTLLGSNPEIEVLNVQLPLPARACRLVGQDSLTRYYEDEAAKVFEPVRAELNKVGFQAGEAFLVGEASDSIAAEAEKFGADLIVMGSRGQTALRGLFFGSVSNAVLAHTHRPILMLRDKLPEGTSLLRIGIACDGSEYGERAVDFVLKNRALFGSETRYELLNAGRSTHTIGLSSMASMMSSPTAAADMVKLRGQHFDAVMAALMPKFEAEGIKPRPVRLDGNPGEVIADYAENTPLDLLLMGSHGYGNLRSALMGSTAQKIAANSSVPLLIIR